ncbi:carbohydrate ABC transporter permease [Paenibacillus albiflavus]|uniref:Carbohydrate ABC transporter permease n=1 Tax=Paenibacillus albiflavus TaxID=2545760 RepID=A0A4R4E6B1_9BACL|nr:carbohydrate ABC transporter permease [Paenibacillus albiflavus]TCZ73215.1 carbohydrate ABC transporter permease [Paenibacillus albiflavus]
MKRVKKIVVGFLFLILFITQVYPLLWLFLYSFKTTQEILDGNFFALPAVPQWINYKNAYVSGHYLQYLFNSIVVTAASMALTILLSAMVSFAISRFRWRYGNVVMLVFMIGIMIPIQSTLLPLMIIFKNMTILNTYLSLIIPYVAFAIPLAIFILSSFMKSIPHEIEESAIMDGASVYRVFSNVVMPITIPPIVTVCILTFISTWNEYIMAATFVTAERFKTLPFGVYSFFSQYSTNYGAIGAYLVLGALPVLMIYFTLSQKITAGIVAGAVKG